MGTMKELFGEIAKAKTWEKGVPLEAGEYPSLTLAKLFVNKGFKGTTGIAEVVVNESRSAEEGVSPAPVGAKRTILFSFKDEFGYGLGRLKAFVLMLFGADDKTTPAEEIGATIFDLLADDKEWREAGREGPSPHKAQPMRGKTFACTAHTAYKNGAKVVAKNGQPVVNYTSRYIQQDEASMAAERKRLDAGGF